MSYSPTLGKRSRIVEALASAIRNNELRPGDQIEGENELARRFSVSRGTVRQALEELKRRRLITTRPGIGSFVTFDGVAIDQSVGWARALQQACGEVTTEVIDIVTLPWSAIDLPAELGDATRAPAAVRIRRVRRLANTTAISYETSLVPAVGQLAELPATGLTNGSLWDTLAQAGLSIVSASQQISVVRLDDTDAQVLGRAPGSAFLCTERTSYGRDGGFVEQVVSLLDPDHFRIVVNFGESAGVREDQ